MSDVSKLLERIDGTIAAAKERVRQQQEPLLQDHAERQERLQRFEQARDEVRAIAKPRLEALARRFGDQVQVTRVHSLKGAMHPCLDLVTLQPFVSRAV